MNANNKKSGSTIEFLEQALILVFIGLAAYMFFNNSYEYLNLPETWDKSFKIQFFSAIILIIVIIVNRLIKFFKTKKIKTINILIGTNIILVIILVIFMINSFRNLNYEHKLSSQRLRYHDLVNIENDQFFYALNDLNSSILDKKNAIKVGYSKLEDPNLATTQVREFSASFKTFIDSLDRDTFPSITLVPYDNASFTQESALDTIEKDSLDLLVWFSNKFSTKNSNDTVYTNLFLNDTINSDFNILNSIEVVDIFGKTNYSFTEAKIALCLFQGLMLYKSNEHTYEAMKQLNKITDELVFERSDDKIWENLSNVYYAKGVISYRESPNKLTALNHYKRAYNLDKNNLNAIKKIIYIYDLDLTKTLEKVKTIEQSSNTFLKPVIDFCDTIIYYKMKLHDFRVRMNDEEMTEFDKIEIKARQLKEIVVELKDKPNNGSES